ncbi:MAG: PTS sugar transporter subunit IIA [Pseudomonadales bacterium]|nr:PTS sugar transporter subunit IIA [Pseudomonadales bacterium]
MLDINNVLDSSCTLTVNRTISKKGALQRAAETLADRFPVIDPRELFDQLMERENLGSTGLGEGVAIPHCRISQIDQVAGAFIRLQSPIEFEAPDDMPIDLMFVLIVPETAEASHLEMLSIIATVFSNSEHRTLLRDTSDDNNLHRELLDLLISSHQKKLQ